MMAKPMDVEILHYTGTVADTDQQRRLDIRKLLDSGADVITLSRQGGMMKIIQSEIRKDDEQAGAKYRYHHAGPLGVLLKRGKDTSVKGSGKVRYHAVTEISAYWIKITLRGKPLSIVVSRWLPDGKGKGHGGSAAKLAALIKRQGKNHPVFFAGDVQVTVADKFPHAYFKNAGLATIWQDEGGYPDTAKYGRTPDVIGRYSSKDVIRSAGYKIRPGYNANKNVISAFYKIYDKPADAPSAPTSGDKGTGSDDPYLTAGDISWADYLDESVYPLESVVWDTTGHHR